MEISKGKILIYVLTFAAYAWTGYGADVLSHLKDAVVSAESFFGDVFDKAFDVVKNIKDFQKKIDNTIEEECIFQCSNGAKPKPNKYHKPMPNGCGPEGLKIDTGSLPLTDMTQCCNDHDICYGTCNKDRDKCDLDFKKCLYKICDKTSDPVTSKGCKVAAKVFFTGTTTLGCDFYLEAQREACYCDPKSSNQKYRKEEF